MNPKDLLPIGSVVLLRNGNKRLMIYGFLQKHLASGRIFDYIGCLYPEGFISPEYSFVFDHADIVQVIHHGFYDEEERRFKANLQRNHE